MVNLRHIYVFGRFRQGFTLAELLIALAILGVIATFTIPKILDSGSSSEWNAKAKEAIGMVSGAYKNYQLDNGIGSRPMVSDLTQYMNFVREETVIDIDNRTGQTSIACSNPSQKCYVLHNGSILEHWSSHCLAANETTSAIYFHFDPDGKYSGSTTGPGKSLEFYIYANGRVLTRAQMLPNTYSGNFAGTCGSIGPFSFISGDPDWLDWSN